MSWKTLNLTAPSSAVNISGSVSTALNTVKFALTTTRTILNSISILNTNLDNLLQTSITNITNLLSSLNNNVGAYYLRIPPPKKGIFNFVANNENQDELGSNFVSIPREAMLNGLTEAEKTALRGSHIFETAFNPESNFSGGNRHILKTVIESLYDPNDQNKPNFNGQQYWAYGLLMCGASDITSIIPQLNFLNNLTGGSNNTTVNVNRNFTDVVVQNIRTRISSQNTGIVIEWDLPNLNQVLTSFDGSTINPVEIALIRSEEFQARSARRVMDLFRDTNLTEGKEGLYKAKVISIKRFDGITQRFIDQSAEIGKNYIYHVAVKTRITPPEDISSSTVETLPTPSEMAYNLLSNGSAITLTSANNSNLRGAPPDWERTTSVAVLFPAVNRLLDVVKEQIDLLSQNAQQITQLNSSLLQSIDNQINALEQKINELDLIAGQINSLFSSAPSAGIYINFATGQGALNTLLAKLTTEFNSEESPPFLDDEYTAGVLMLLVSPDPSILEQSFNLLDGLINPNTANELITGITSGTTQLQQEALTNLQATLSEISVGFNNDLTGRPEGQGNSPCD